MRLHSYYAIVYNIMSYAPRILHAAVVADGRIINLTVIIETDI